MKQIKDLTSSSFIQMGIDGPLSFNARKYPGKNGPKGEHCMKKQEWPTFGFSEIPFTVLERLMESQTPKNIVSVVWN
ncbi:hypothetical protein GCM10010916_38460 [Paenibacillus abyssi]|uniref:Uncharacterized protein n=1 Tax=Paenibacillus abyssi TaxID=1340531 RepID=A0A917G1Y1_9BACL|nr:hypothetical protein GCM10010916_38460 [Paenibacillus abyssi]